MKEVGDPMRSVQYRIHIRRYILMGNKVEH